MLYTLKGIIGNVFFKGIINKISFKVSSFNPWNITNQVCFKDIISFNFWNNPHFQKTRCGFKPNSIFKILDVALNLLTLSKDHI